MDPYHLAGSGSTSGNVDTDPGSQKKSCQTNTKINQNYKNIIFFLRNHLFYLVYVNNKLIIYKKEFLKKIGIRIKNQIRTPGSGSADPGPDPHQNREDLTLLLVKKNFSPKLKILKLSLCTTIYTQWYTDTA